MYYSDPNVIYLSDISPTSNKQDWGELYFDKSTNGDTIKINNTAYYKGLDTHANSEIVYAIDSLSQIYSKFSAVIGHDDESNSDATDGVSFEIVIDGQTVYGPSEIFKNGTPGQLVEVDIRVGVTLKLLVHAGENDYNDHADWAEAKLSKGSNSIREEKIRIIEDFVLKKKLSKSL